MFTCYKNDSIPDIGESPYLNIPVIDSQASGITKLLKDLDPSKATDPDIIPAKFLKLVAEDLTPCLFILFSASLKQGVIPTVWKSAMVTPICDRACENRACGLLKLDYFSNFWLS